MSARSLVEVLTGGLAVTLFGLFLALAASAASAWGRWSHRPVVVARVVGHEPLAPARGGRVGRERWRTVVAWADAAGDEVRAAVEPPPMEPGLPWLREGDVVSVHVDPTGRRRPRRLDEPGQALRSALVVGSSYLLAPAVLCAAVYGALHR